MKYQMLEESDKDFKIQHPDGSHFKVAKRGLEKNMVERIKKMGIRMQDGGAVPQVTPEPVQTPPPSTTLYEPGATPLPRVADSDLKVNLTPQDMPQTVKYDEQTPAVITAKKPSAMDQASLGSMYEHARAGILGKEEAQTNLAQEQQLQYEATAEKLARQADASNKARAALDAEQSQLFSAAKNGHIDPKRLWSNASTGSKVAAGIGLILGGMGAGLTRGPNMAMEMFNKLLNNDIDAQKANMNQANNLMQVNFQKYRNIEAAETATRLQLSTVLQAQLAAAASRAATPEAKANAQLALAQLDQQTIPMKFQLAQMQAMYGLQSGGQQQVNPEMLPEDARQRIIMVPGPDGMKQKLAPSKEDADAFRKSEIASDELEEKLAEAKKFMDEKGTTMWGTEDQAKADSLHASILSSIGKLHDLNRLSDADLTLFEQMVPNPGQWMQTQGKAKLDMLMNYSQSKRNAAYKQYAPGYNPGQFKAQEKPFK